MFGQCKMASGAAVNDLRHFENGADTVQPVLNFRSQLRVKTRPEHDATECLFDPFLRDPMPKLGWYLAAQRAGLAALFTDQNPDDVLCGALVPDLIDRLDHDLHQMGWQCHPVETSGPIDPTACDYLVLGSRLGTEVIRRNIFGSGAHQTVPSYFQAPFDTNLWRVHCATLDQIDPTTKRADHIIIDVRRGFEVFETAARSQQD